ncbi:hypothetical protein KF840_17250 [bacterium]|nr:hypothetical protein [bacterium]
MGWRGTVALLVVVVAAAAYLYHDVNAGRTDGSWSAIFEEPQEPPPADLVKRLLAFDAAGITAITVRRGTQEWRAERTADGWSGAGRATDMNDFLHDLAALAEIMPIEVAPDTLRDHGLDPPQASIELTRSGAPPLVLLVGARNPPATGVYVRVGADGPVVLTGALLLWDLEKIERALAPPPS